MPRIMLHMEGLAVFIGAVVLYGHISGNWLVFLLLLFTPDVAMIGYLVNTRLGSLIYNVVHTYTLALIIALIALALESTTGVSLGLILFAHIGIDRTMGYGLKYPTAFKDTHFNYV